MSVQNCWKMESGKTPLGGKMGLNLVTKNIELQSIGKNQKFLWVSLF